MAWNSGLWWQNSRHVIQKILIPKPWSRFKLQAELIKELEKDAIGIEAEDDIGKPIHYTEVDRDWPDVELERRDENVTVAYLEEHGYEETDTGREENTFQILGDGKIIAYTPISDPKSIRKKVEQKN